VTLAVRSSAHSLARLCSGCQRRGRCRLGLVEERLEADGSSTSFLSCPEEYEGGPQVAHGGWTADALDEVLGHLPILHGMLSVTKTITVDYLRPVPIERPLIIRARFEERGEKHLHTAGEMLLVSSGAVLATARGIWSIRTEAHFERFRQWLATQEPGGSATQEPSGSAFSGG
jgi:acyl-coenzyme A thioesterase PaaI-like protein